MITLFLLACTSIESADNRVITTGDHFFDRPWPSDLRRSDGTLDLKGWPNEGSSVLLDTFLELGETLTGFGNNAPIFHRFENTLDLSLLPTEQESLENDSNIFLVNITQGSPRRGDRIPISWEYYEEETQWLNEKTLSIAPTWGNPLDVDADYAVVITKNIASLSDEFAQAFDEESDLYTYFSDAIETLELLEIDPETIAHITRFHTQNPVQEMVQLATTIKDQVSKPPLDQKVAFVRNLYEGKAYEGELLIPLWQHGEKPYSTEGGGFRFDESGIPIMYDWEKTRFTLSVPDGEMPEDGWPVAVYSHGTGGSDRGFAASDRNTSPGAQFAKAGFVGIGISQPLHGDRNTGGSPELYSFNYLNPESGKSTFRQGAADQIYLSHLMAEHAHHFTTDDGSPDIILNPNHIVYVGHSHGGEVGAMAIPFFPKSLKTAVLSGTGGGISLALLYRKSDDFDFEVIMRNALAFDDDEDLSSFHPIVALVQLHAEVTDPLNYAPYWFRSEPWWDSHPISIYQTEGLLDESTPPISTEALSGAARSPIIDTPLQWLPTHELYDLFAEGSNIQGNVIAYDGSQQTAGLRQYEDEDHFVIFNSLRNARKYRLFLESSLEGLPILE